MHYSVLWTYRVAVMNPMFQLTYCDMRWTRCRKDLCHGQGRFPRLQLVWWWRRWRWWEPQGHLTFPGYQYIVVVYQGTAQVPLLPDTSSQWAERKNTTHSKSKCPILIVNLLVPERCGCNLKSVIFKLIQRIWNATKTLIIISQHGFN